MGKVKNEVGNRYGRWEVIEERGRSKTGQAVWLCRCDCGNTATIVGTELRQGRTHSCGCLRREIAKKQMTTHGLSRTPLFYNHRNMISRCYNSNDKDFPRYGGRKPPANPISVCKEWKHNFKAYYDWCMENGWKHGLQVDRIDNNGNYCPENCRVTTCYINSHNRRKMSTNTSGYEGVTYVQDMHKYHARLMRKGKRVNLGYYLTAKDGAIARDRYIIDNDIGHEYKLQVLNTQT